MNSIDKRNFILLLISMFSAVIMIYSDRLKGSDNRQKKNPHTKQISKHKTQLKCNNPIYDKLKKEGRKHKLNLEFTCNIQQITGRMRSFESAIFCHKPESLDVILFGDSTIGWAIIPQVIEQKTGLKVGIFALRGMYLNRRSLSVLQKIKEHYLKKDGISIFAFDQWTQEKHPNIFRRRDELSNISKMSNYKFRLFADKRFKLCNGYNVDRSKIKPERKNTSIFYTSASLFSLDAYKKYNKKTLLLQKFLRIKAGLQLPRRTFLHKKISKVFNPAWYNKKKMDDIPQTKSLVDNSINNRLKSSDENPYKFKKNGLISEFRYKRIWIRWDHYSLSIYMKKPTRMSIFSNKQPKKKVYISRYLRENSKALIEFPGQKAYLITFYPRHQNYITLRGYYNRLYKDHLKLIDLGVLHPVRGGFPMDFKAHLVNTGGLHKSLAIARWLRKNFKSGN